jgi:glycerol-3-phosphate dehydrogenase
MHSAMRPAAANPFERSAMLDRLAAETFDVVVIGGGITGVGTALDAASRGLRTALVERDDFASGTSSKSSKLIHGGLRYLQQGEIRLVYEALHERQRLRHNAPHLVHLLPFLIPVLTRDGVMNRKLARAFGSALWMYDLTGGWRIGKRHKRLDKAAALAHLPTMPADKLASAYLYYDATADDARLCLTVARTAAAQGAAIANRAEVIAVLRDAESRAAGVVVRADGRRIEVRARAVVNAGGVWADDVRALDEGRDPDSIRPAKGVHISVPWDLVRNDIAVVIPVPGDKRSLFLVPWGARPDGSFEHTYIGTTDTDYSGALDDPTCTTDDVAYVLRALDAAITTRVSPSDVTGAWAGLRPLVKADPAPPSRWARLRGAKRAAARTADLSRRHRVVRSESGVVTVTGGKLTTYREMAEDTVDEVVDLLGLDASCRTKKLRLLGANGYREPPAGSPDAHLATRYGTLAAEVRALIAADPSLGDPLVPGQPYLRAEAVYAVRAEMATTLIDVVARRTRAHLFDRAATRLAAPAIAELIAPELGWDATETARQVAAYVAMCDEEDAAARPPAPAATITGAPLAAPELPGDDPAGAAS